MAPVQNTTKLGLQEDSATGKITGFQGNTLAGNGLLAFVSDAYIQGQSGAQAQTALWVAATSGQYLITWSIEVSSVSVTGSYLIPQVRYWTYGTGAGLDMFGSNTTALLANFKQAYSGSMWVRSAASTIFVQVFQGGSAGVPPVYNLNWSIYQGSS